MRKSWALHLAEDVAQAFERAGARLGLRVVLGEDYGASVEFHGIDVSSWLMLTA